MARSNRFTFLCTQEELRIIATLAKRSQRSQSDAIRLLIREAARALGSQNQATRDEGADTSREVQVLAETEIISKNQSGEITAHSEIIQGGSSQTTFGAGAPAKEKRLIWTILRWISAIALFLAAIVAILTYFRISPP